MIRRAIATGSVVGLVLITGAFVMGQEKPKAAEQERAVKESEMPAKAMAALKKLAGGAAFTEFAEEIEHGHTFYEGSWKGADGNVDALVTDGGDLVEIEEEVPADKVPAPTRTEAEKEAGKGTKLMWEKKTVVLYEVHFKKDGKGREMILTPDGRHVHEEGGNGQDRDEDEEQK